MPKSVIPASETEAASARAVQQNRALSKFSSGLSATLIKIVLLGGVNALGIFAIIALASQGSWVGLGFVALGLIILDVIYGPANKMIPGKYLAPGIAFMIVFQVFVMCYTVYIAFTNYGDAHMGTKQDAIAAIQVQNQDRVPDSPAYPVTILSKGNQLSMAVVDPETKKAKVGSNKSPMEIVDDATVTGDKVD
ncbi:MAG: ABC transporter permease subunit, partial [Propionibacteriaceae bacterium]